MTAERALPVECIDSEEQDDIEAKHEQRAHYHLNETIHSTILKGYRMIGEVPHLNAKHRSLQSQRKVFPKEIQPLDMGGVWHSPNKSDFIIECD